MLGALLGQPQRNHDHLYWEIGAQIAVRHGKWKALRRGKQPWQLFDLDADVSETNDVAASNAGVMAKLIAMADNSHQPVREGTFASRDLHEKDRRAKYGENAPKQNRRRNRAKHRLPKKGMLANDKWKVVRVSSESKSNGKVAANAIDLSLIHI